RQRHPHRPRELVADRRCRRSGRRRGAQGPRRMNPAIRANSLRARLREGKAVYGMFAVEFFSPGLCQIAANAGADFVLFDMEHGGVGIDVLKAQFAFARGTGITPLVRVPALHYHLIAPVLDAGAMGIMVPMLET